MSLGILTNVSAIYAENNLNQTQASLNTTLQQLSSGSRINSGADDAAGLSVANGLGANVAALTQSQQNASDATGLLQTADGALSQVTNLLDRAVTLATEAANGTLTSTQISSANQEYQNILSEIGDIGSTTNFNSSNVFSGAAKSFLVSDGTASGANTYSDTVGALTTASVGETSLTQGTASVSSALTNPTPVASTTGAGSTATFTLGAASDTLAGSITVAYAGYAGITTVLAAGTTVANAAQQLNAQYIAAGSSLVASVANSGTSLVITGPADTATAGTNDLIITGTSLTQSTLATQGTSGGGQSFTGASAATLTAGTASTVLTDVTAAINDVSYQRGVIGADINELTAASNVAGTESVNLTTSQSSILSTNYGQATSNLAKFQVLSQTGISALAQANTVQQEVLKLLQ